jgi:hypothetical protein
MSGSTESEGGSLSRRGFFRWASSLAAGASDFLRRQGPFIADGIVRW